LGLGEYCGDEAEYGEAHEQEGRVLQCHRHERRDDGSDPSEHVAYAKTLAAHVLPELLVGHQKQTVECAATAVHQHKYDHLTQLLIGGHVLHEHGHHLDHLKQQQRVLVAHPAHSEAGQDQTE